MALNGNVLGDAIVAALGIAADPGLSAAEKTEIKNKWRAIGGAVVAHITGSGVVNPGTFQTLDVTTGVELVTGQGTIS